jgi:3',5'-cyclic AMP phosphodiesterase CpdA
MGNHDDRAAYARELLDAETDGGPQDAVHDVDGLRIIALDTTVPGWHHGEVDDRQLEWLAGVLAEPAPHGSILAVHHPPIPVPMVPAAQIIELLDQSRLAAVLEGSDVRAILGGHFHFSSHSLFAGIPVSVAAATCYTLDPAPLDRLVSSTDGHQAVNVVHVYGDRLVHSVVPVAQAPEIHGYPAEVTALLEAMTPAERREMFSRKGSDFNTADAAWSGGS